MPSGLPAERGLSLTPAWPSCPGAFPGLIPNPGSTAWQPPPRDAASSQTWGEHGRSKQIKIPRLRTCTRALQFAGLLDAAAGTPAPGCPPALGGLCQCSPQPVRHHRPRRLRQLAKDAAMGAGEPFQPGPESIHHLIYLTALGPPCQPRGKQLGQGPALPEFKKSSVTGVTFPWARLARSRCHQHWRCQGQSAPAAGRYRPGGRTGSPLPRWWHGVAADQRGHWPHVRGHGRLQGRGKGER